MVYQKKICIILALLAWLLWEWIKQNHPQIYLEECKYRVKKIQMSRFISAELESDLDSDSDSGYDTVN